tara:strand:- start:5047 stop:5799 length:753 start_codon:yes stop_codon:yes gene_type:complete
MNNEVQIFCCSKGRAKQVSTTHYLRPEVMKFVVPFGEGELYKEYNPAYEVIETPKGLKGITKTKQWLMDSYEEFFTIDDDVTFLRKNYVDEGEEYKCTDPDMVYEIIREAANTARQMGAKLYGFAHFRVPKCYRSAKPVMNTGFMISSSFGVLKGHKLWYDTRMNEGEDYWLSLLNGFVNRFSYIDNRFSFHTKDNFQGQGGCNDYRTIESMKENTLALRRAFGEAVNIKASTNVRGKVNVGERSIKFPF